MLSTKCINKPLVGNTARIRRDDYYPGRIRPCIGRLDDNGRRCWPCRIST